MTKRNAFKVVRFFRWNDYPPDVAYGMLLKFGKKRFILVQQRKRNCFDLARGKHPLANAHKAAFALLLMT